MSEKSPCLLDEQKKTRPKIEDVAPDYLDGDMLTSAMGFAAHMNENKTILRWAGITNAWIATYKGKSLCRVNICAEQPWENNKKWIITPYLNHLHEYEESVLSEGLQNIIWDNFTHCRGCGRRTKEGPCIGGYHVTLLGRECKGICRINDLIKVRDPDETAISGVKRLLDLEKEARNEVSKRSVQS